MEIKVNTSLMETRSSRGLVKDIVTSTSESQVHEPLVEWDLLLRMFRNDEVIFTALSTTVDMVSRNGYDFAPKSDDKLKFRQEKKRAIETFNGPLNFNEILDNWVFCKLLYGDTFIEKRRTADTVIDELWVLETTEMKIEHDMHGEVVGYWQRPRNLSGFTNSQRQKMETDGGIFFPAKDVIHDRSVWIGSQVYSYTPLESVARAFATKLRANSYLREIFENLPPLRVWELRGADRESKDNFKNQLYLAKTRALYDLVQYGGTESETKFTEIIPKFDEGLLNTLEHLREQVLMVTRVPPVWVGMVNNEGANRGNSEAQIFSFETRVKKIQKQIQDKVNKELLPELGFNHLEFNFNPISMIDEKVIIQNMATLASLTVENHRITRKGLLKYLARNGITDFTLDDFEEITSMLPEGNSNQAATNNTAPSRTGMDKKNDMMTNNREKDGSSDAGRDKMEQKQMDTRSMRYWSYNAFH